MDGNIKCSPIGVPGMSLAETVMTSALGEAQNNLLLVDSPLRGGGGGRVVQ